MPTRPPPRPLKRTLIAAALWLSLGILLTLAFAWLPAFRPPHTQLPFPPSDATTTWPLSAPRDWPEPTSVLSIEGHWLLDDSLFFSGSSGRGVHYSMFARKSGRPFRSLCDWHIERITAPLSEQLSEHHPTWVINLPLLGRISLPTFILWPGFILDTLFFAAILWLPIRGPRLIRSWLRSSAGQCIACGYSRTGLADAAICPECAAPATTQHPPQLFLALIAIVRHWRSRPLRTRLVRLTAWVLIGVMLTITTTWIAAITCGAGSRAFWMTERDMRAVAWPYPLPPECTSRALRELINAQTFVDAHKAGGIGQGQAFTLWAWDCGYPSRALTSWVEITETRSGVQADSHHDAWLLAKRPKALGDYLLPLHPLWPGFAIDALLWSLAAALTWNAFAYLRHRTTAPRPQSNSPTCTYRVSER